MPVGKHWRLSPPDQEIVARLLLLVAVWLTPAVLIDNIGEGNPANRPKAAQRVTDRQNRIGMPVRRQAERSLRFLLERQIERRQGSTKAEGSRRQQHVLYGRVDRRTGCS